MALSVFPDNLFDKNGQRIYEDDVMYDGENYYRIYWNSLHPNVEAVGGPNGYIHNLTQKDLSHFVRIGPFLRKSRIDDSRLTTLSKQKGASLQPSRALGKSVSQIIPSLQSKILFHA